MANVDAVQPQVRRIAVLVTSLDTQAGRQLLAAMPSALARQVRQAMASLTRIDPEEQRQVLAEFRKQALLTEDRSNVVPVATQSANAVQRNSTQGRESQSIQNDALDVRGYSAPSATDRGLNGAVQAPLTADSIPWPTPADVKGNGAYQNAGENSIAAQDRIAQTTTESTSENWKAWDVDALIHLLDGERATVTAVVLSQIAPQQAVKLLERMSGERRSDVMMQLARLGSIDPDAMTAIDEHLARRIADYHHQRSTESESTARFKGLLGAASDALRAELQDSIQRADAGLARRLGLTSTAPIPAKHETRTTAANVGRTEGPPTHRSAMPAQPSTNGAPTRMQSEQQGVTEPDTSAMWASLANNVITTVDESSAWHDQPDVIPFRRPQAQTESELRPELRFEQILDLDADLISEVLGSVQRDVLLLALAGATPQFMKRFHGMLDKSDGKLLQQQLRNIGVINLQDVDAAQDILAQNATLLMRSQSKTIADSSSRRAA
ncbi:MAG: FliG C-terminal domain-containing protein [Pirellulales bacterium]